MTIKNILCAYSGEAARGSGLRHAIRLAKHHDAWLTGVLRHGTPPLERHYSLQLPDGVVDVIRRNDAERIAEIKARFNTITSEHGVADRAEFVDLDAEKGDSLSEFARCFDLVVTGVHSHVVDEAHMSANPDLIALRSGRPIVIVPDGYEAEQLADHALVAWDGKRSAARAVGDATTLLGEKTSVTVLTVGDKPTADGERLIRNLKRRGINASLVTRPRSGTVAKTILSTAEEFSARVVVMGAFEHSKFSHDLIGGVTTDVMRDTKVPVFMAH